MSVQVGKNKCASVNRRKFHIFGKYVYLLCTSVRFITLNHVSHQLREVSVNFFSQICHFSDLMLSGGVLRWLKMLQNVQGSNIHIFTASKFDVSAWLCCISSVSDGDSITQRKSSLLTKAAGSRRVAGFIIRTHFGEDTVTSSMCLQTSAAFHFLNFEVQFLPRYLWTQADYRQKHLVFPFLVGTIYNKHICVV